jgi:hypothetical protein
MSGKDVPPLPASPAIVNWMLPFLAGFVLADVATSRHCFAMRKFEGVCKYAAAEPSLSQDEALKKGAMGTVELGLDGHA